MNESDPTELTPDLREDVTARDLVEQPEKIPASIDRYQVVSLLGRGGFGVVYLARDESLDRRVAIKVPSQKLIQRDGQAALYLEEARAVAQLDHPCIVPVYDIGSTSEYPCFVVSKYIDGRNLAKAARHQRLTFRESAEVVASIADALHFGHRHGIIHRDVKPGNILLDRDGKPYLVDYGLALQDRNPEPALRCAGTPTYMSPEQARGEGHRVDGRSDIFSLGVVLYELLVARKPFRGNTTAEILKSVTSLDPQPPRQLNDNIPRELERICLKALSRRTTDRYTTALDMAEDLRHFIDDAEQSAEGAIPDAASSPQAISTDAASQSAISTPVSASMPSWVGQPAPMLVPKGLRSFDHHDSDFFLELLPGPRDRDGLPDSIRFWKTRIDETDRDQTFEVGLIYGPSGCGKSSFVKAGLLPNLGSHVTPVYVEATDDDTEARLLAGLRKQLRTPVNEDLGETVASLRHGDGIGDDQKVLIVIDQFEQWLHARLDRDDSELIDAIRQCDGARVQCIVMIRDDFWMAATRFMRAVEVRLSEGENSLAVDLFEPRHAKRVLASFGRAFRALPFDAAQTSRSQTNFLEKAIKGLEQDGKVVCVRLALFAEMMKGKVWEPSSLHNVGGAEGVGTAFLEETFSAKTAPPLHRVHQAAARAVLRRLLPPTGSDIKGHMRSREELLEASGYKARPAEFDELMKLLDAELRLITPTDPEGSESTAADPNQSCYQLAHDYLVPSVRDWLTRKQKETRRGRAQLRQQELAMLWKARPEKQRLPTLTEWIRISALTRRSERNQSEKKMMAAASRHHGLRLVAAIGLLVVIGWGVREYAYRMEAAGLVDQLVTAEIERVPLIVRQLEENGNFDAAELTSQLSQSPDGSDQQVRLAMLMVRDDPSQASILAERLRTGTAPEIRTICARLRDCRVEIVPAMQDTLDNEDESADRRFNAALTIAWHALYAGLECGPILQPHAVFLADELVDRALTQPSGSGDRLELFRPVRDVLLDRMREHFVSDDVIRRAVASGIVADYIVDMPERVAEFLLVSNVEQFTTLFPMVSPHEGPILDAMEQELQKPLESADSDDARTALAKRQSNAAICLLKSGRLDPVWPMLVLEPDPRTRSWIINMSPRLGVSPSVFIDRYGNEDELSSRRALLLTLGSYESDQVLGTARELTVERCKSLIRDEADPGLRASALFLLRAWGLDPMRLVDTPEPSLDPVGDRQWYVEPEGHTMIVLDARDDPRVGHVFDIASTESTIGQVREWRPNKHLMKGYDPSDDCPIGLMTWYQAIAYCQFLNRRNGIPEEEWCYPEFDPSDPPFKVIDADVTKTGFRLPSNAEWQFACRAGSVTSRFYGESIDLLGEYAWYSENATEMVYPVGSLKPNDFGLFDMYGNLNEWREARRDSLTVSIGGGSAGSFGSVMVSDDVGGAVPETRFNSYGLRVVRTRRVDE